jgi:hypothetical protein
MSNANMNALPLDEMERFQKLSNEFEPDVQVGCFRRVQERG